MLPFAGALLYCLFGINRVETRARAMRGTARFKAVTSPADDAPILDGNRVEALHNGEQAYPAMLDAIRSASRYVYLSTYIFGSDDVGMAFARALSDAVRRGADVRVLLDGIGELYTWPRIGTVLKQAGVRCARFEPPRLWPPTLRINLRNHRKILVTDGMTAFTGGMNIAKRHLAEDCGNPSRVVDLHFRFEGPVVGRLEEAFVLDWRLAARESLPCRGVGARPAGSARCRVVADGPDENRDPLLGLLLRAVAGAKRRIAIMTPYFLPPRELMGALQAAALNGVDVAVVLPAKNNLPYVHWATRHMLWEVLLRGVHVYYQPAPFVHSKLLLIDDDSAVVGSWNIDPRSLRLNFELAVEIRDRRLVDGLGAHFEAVRARSRAVTLEEVDGRPLPERLRDAVAWLFSPYL